MTTYHYEHLKTRIAGLKPVFRFDGHWKDNPVQWRSEWKAKFVELLGIWPEQCAPDPNWTLLEKRDKYTLHRVDYLTEPGLAAFALVAIPHTAVKGRTPGALCLHGHGTLGCYPVMNYGDFEKLETEVTRYEYDFGHRLAERGVVVFAPNHRGFGDRLTKRERDAQQNRDTCDVNFFQQMLLGEVALTSQLHDLKVALGILQDIPEVDAENIACAGLSYGGRLTMYLTALDERIKLAVVSGALNAFRERVSHYGTCGYQVVPGLLNYADTPEIFGLIAPRKLGLELGDGDACCPYADARELYKSIASIYTALEAQSAIELFEFSGGHVFRGDQSIPWLLRNMGLPPIG